MANKKVGPKYPSIVVTIPNGTTLLRLVADVSRVMRLNGISNEERNKFYDDCIEAYNSGKKTIYDVVNEWVSLRS
jgi:hypothetical protein